MTLSTATIAGAMSDRAITVTLVAILLLSMLLDLAWKRHRDSGHKTMHQPAHP